MNNHFVTGATGFVGAALVLELLKKDPNAQIWCLARSNSKQPAQERLWQALQAIAQINVGNKLSLIDIVERCHVLEGDLTLPNCGIMTNILQQLPSFKHFWHSAASLNYEDRFRTEIELINIQGTQNALSLARLLGVQHFNYFSTAYVSGQRTGLVLENLMDTHQATNNFYEQSKISAEYLVASAVDLCPRIMRPSIVIGHSQTYALANSYSGLYGFIRRIAKSIAIMERLDKNYLKENALRLRYDPKALLNFIPIDYVVHQAVAIGLQDLQASDVDIYHLTNSTPVKIGKFLDLLFLHLNVFAPIPVENTNVFNEIDQSFSKGIDFYNSYMLYPKQFDRQNSDTALDATTLSSFVMTDSVMLGLFNWYLGYLAISDPRTIERAHLSQRVAEYQVSSQGGTKLKNY